MRKIRRHKEHIYGRLWQIICQCRNALKIDASILISKNGVPHVVTDQKVGNVGRVSITYFLKTRKYKVFYPYCEFDKRQAIRTFNDSNEVKKYISGLTMNKNQV